MATSWLLIAASVDVYQAGIGSGFWIGQLSIKWALGILGVVLTFALILAGIGVILWRPDRISRGREFLLNLRARLSWGRWVFAAMAVIILPWFLLHSYWGGVFTGAYLRLVMFVSAVGILSWLLTYTDQSLIEWPIILGSIVLVGSSFAFLRLLGNVTNYPFSLFWSEGNRIWDYSLLYRPDLYIYPTGKLTESQFYPIGRTLLYGLPYLLPQYSILGIRLWNALLFSLPYSVLGWLALRPQKGRLIYWVLFGLWVFTFLNQGPIWTPLVISAIMVVLVRRSALWAAIPMLILAGYYAGMSRPTWVFAPSIWISMLVFAQPLIERRVLQVVDWWRAIVLGMSGIVGSFVIPSVFPIGPQVSRLNLQLGQSNGGIFSSILDSTIDMITYQSFLWYRLLPNSTFYPGIILGLLFLCVPLILIVLILIRNNRLTVNFWQRLIILGGLAAFLVVGLVASVKIGGGTNLHNLDMFLIGLIIVTVSAIEAVPNTKIDNFIRQSGRARALLFFVVAVPAFWPMLNVVPLVLPPAEETDNAINSIQGFVDCAKIRGEVLFLDQRQLLTFGYFDDVPLVLEYEKKIVMDRALAKSEAYFDGFYTDLADARFSIIIADRQFKVKKDLTRALAEENNAWIKWVTIPLLREYESVAVYKSDRVELFMPKGRTYQCP